jgi:hypothetical protein
MANQAANRAIIEQRFEHWTPQAVVAAEALAPLARHPREDQASFRKMFDKLLVEQGELIAALYGAGTSSQLGAPAVSRSPASPAP